MQVTRVARGPARGGVAAGQRPSPFGQQHVHLGEAAIEAIRQVVASLDGVPVSLEHDHLMTCSGQGVHDGPPPEPASIRGIRDTRTQETPEAVADPQPDARAHARSPARHDESLRDPAGPAMGDKPPIARIQRFQHRRRDRAARLADDLTVGLQEQDYLLPVRCQA